MRRHGQTTDLVLYAVRKALRGTDIVISSTIWNPATILHINNKIRAILTALDIEALYLTKERITIGSLVDFNLQRKLTNIYLVNPENIYSRTRGFKGEVLIDPNNYTIDELYKYSMISTEAKELFYVNGLYRSTKGWFKIELT